MDYSSTFLINNTRIPPLFEVINIDQFYEFWTLNFIIHIKLAKKCQNHLIRLEILQLTQPFRRILSNRQQNWHGIQYLRQNVGRIVWKEIKMR